MDRPKGIIKNSSRRRQEPVSCLSCRLKKWKCNRQHPCSNCVARDLVCEGNNHTANGSKHNEPDNATKAILERLDKLEKALLERDPGMTQQQIGTEPTHEITRREETSEKEWQQVDDLKVALNISMPSSSPPLRMIQQRIRDSLIANPTFQSRVSPSPKGAEWVTLPDKEEALALLDHYARLASHMHYIVYMPTVRIMLDQVYDRMDDGQPCEHGQVALLLSIFATTSNIWRHGNDKACIFESVADALKCSTTWAEGALALLEHKHNSGCSSLEQVQASVILTFAMLGKEGLSAKSWWLSNTAIIAARDLSLHVLDGRKEMARRAKSPEDQVQLEMKRRLWWYLAASDWAMSLVPGPHEGTYSIHPAHMRVNKPWNLDDNDLAHTSSSFDRPMNEPTTVSYLLQRFRLAELSRDIVDAIPIASAGPADPPYETIILLDKRFEQYQNELPTFFKNDETSLERSRKIHGDLPHIAIQRYIIGFTSNTRRLKLHLPFIARASLDGRYQYSRNVVRQCTHAVIQLNVSLEEIDSSGGSYNLKLGFAMHHLYWATAVLVMDQCYNNQQRIEDERITDIAVAFRMLERSKDKVWMTHNLLHSLTSVLERHDIYIPRNKQPINQDDISPAHNSNPEDLEILPLNQGNDLSTPNEDLPQQDTLPMVDNHRWWYSTNDESEFQMLDWDQLFNDLTSAIG